MRGTLSGKKSMLRGTRRSVEARRLRLFFGARRWAVLVVTLGVWGGVGVVTEASAASSSKKAANPLSKIAGSRVCENSSFPGFRGSEKAFRWKTTPHCHSLEQGKHVVCENDSADVTYVETSTWDEKAKSITTRFYISSPYKDYDVTTYTFNAKRGTFDYRGKEDGVDVLAVRTYRPNGGTHFTFSSVTKGQTKLLLEIKCTSKNSK